MSMIELMVVVAIVAVLAGIAVPHLGGWLQRSQLASASNEMLAMLLLARSEAIKRGHRVTACVSRDNAHCATDADWHDGWMVFLDLNGNAVRDAGEEVLLRGPARSDGVTVTGNQPVKRSLGYVATGGTRSVGGGLLMGTLTICSRGSARYLIVNAVGRPRLAVGTC